MRIEDRIRTKLLAAFDPERLEVVNDSARHAGHAGAAGGVDGETHFNVLIVSEVFAGLGRVARHRMVTDQLKKEFLEGLHSFQLTAQTSAEAVVCAPMCA